MPPKSTQTLANLRIDAEGVRGSFEEFCCQLFRHAPEARAKSRFRRIRGAGGDGGVEATWTFSDEKVWGLQAKFFAKLGASEKAQLTESVWQATANYPSLERYTICLPFNLTGKTGAKAGKPKNGQQETLSFWIAEWKAELTRRGHTVEFDLWDESELLGRLAVADPTGGLTHYWFNGEALSDAWFEQHWREAKAQAGPRYSPELRVETPLDDALQAFGRSNIWIKKIENLRDRFADELNLWRQISTQSGGQFAPLPEALVEDAKTLLAEAEPLEDHLDLAAENPSVLTSAPCQNAVRSSIDSAAALEPILKAALLKKHGPSADTPGFRQYRAEYHLDFPMAPLDRLIKLLGMLREAEPLAFHPEGQLPPAAAMLLRGEAGIGKTHGIVDSAATRGKLGLRSVVLFGEDITGPDPWTSISAKLGFGTALGRDAMLVALDSAGETSGFPLVIFIDALNETQPDRRRWQAWLPTMIEQIKPHSSLKLCVSCRDIYVRDVIPRALCLPTVVHNGFSGREYEAQFAFFQHYGLGVPAGPLLQDEFANPLFLRLVCEALQEFGIQAIPAGREGIRSVIELLFGAKNKKAAAACDYDPRSENRVSAAMRGLAAKMAEAGATQLPLLEAKELVDGPRAVQSRSLFAILEEESLVATVERPKDTLGDEPAYSVRFTFERVADHLIVEYLLSCVQDIGRAFAAGGKLRFLSESDASARANAGLLEALSIQLPETHGVELIDTIDGIAPILLQEPFIAGLQWRNSSYIADRTRELVRIASSRPDTAAAAFDAIFSLAARPDHPLNATFLDQLLRRIPMLSRDPFWANILAASYSDWSDRVKPGSNVHRLIDTALRADLTAIPDNVASLWGIALAWFYASPDRRIRDRATMAMVSLLRARPSVIVCLLRRFAQSDDEYIAERVLVASYGALLLHPSRPHLHEAATELYKCYFVGGEPPLNASLRDHARLIIELSVELKVPPPQLRPDSYQPPYSSPWPIELPSDEDVKPFADDLERFPEMSLLLEPFGTDFARYIVEPRVVNAFNLEGPGLSKLGLFRWFLKRVVELGYPGPKNRSALFDRNLLATFGGGRGKPGWAERLGKKYYWILLHQLVGQVADHVDRKSWSSPKSDAPTNNLQGLDLRDIDPTDLRMFSRDFPADESWLTPCSYVLTGPDSPEDDAVWVAEDDLPAIEPALILSDGSGISWHGLDESAIWNGKRADRKVTTYRHVTRIISAATCAVIDISRVKRAFSKGPLDFDSHPRDYRGYLGEYPRRWPYRSRGDDGVTFGFKSEDIDFDHIALRQLRGGEWERDYSQIGGSPSLLMPSTDLVGAGDLQWDGRGSWLDARGTIQVMDPRWWCDKAPGLIVRVDYLDQFLEQNGKALVIIGYQGKTVVETTTWPGRLTERTLLIRSCGQTKLIKRKVTIERPEPPRAFNSRHTSRFGQGQ